MGWSKLSCTSVDARNCRLCFGVLANAQCRLPLCFLKTFFPLPVSLNLPLYDEYGLIFVFVLPPAPTATFLIPRIHVRVVAFTALFVILTADDTVADIMVADIILRTAVIAVIVDADVDVDVDATTLRPPLDRFPINDDALAPRDASDAHRDASPNASARAREDIGVVCASNARGRSGRDGSNESTRAQSDVPHFATHLLEVSSSSSSSDAMPTVTWMRVALVALGAGMRDLVARMKRRDAREEDGQRDWSTLEERLRAATEQRAAERAGRTRAERALREAELELERVRASRGATTATEEEEEGDAETYSFAPLGTFASVFNQRLGTPRQPSLVPLARGRVVLSPRVPASALEGLEEFTHCWIVYVFHENTDLVGTLGSHANKKTTVRGKIRVPKLNGEKRGCLATRTPHRPCPVGLSLVEIVRVNDKSLDVAGADLLDGSPVLDIKPYVPCAECLPKARAPDWVGSDVNDWDGPLKIEEVSLSEAGATAVSRAWESKKDKSLYHSAEEFLEFVKQALGRDLRSYHQRLKSDSGATEDEEWHVTLDGIVISYTQSGRNVEVVGAR